MTIQDCLNCPWPTCDGRCPKAKPEKHPGGQPARTYDGKTIREWSAETGIKYHTLCRRLRKGETMQTALLPLHMGRRAT